jgi:hypothetical protein
MKTATTTISSSRLLLKTLFPSSTFSASSFFVSSLVRGGGGGGQEAEVTLYACEMEGCIVYEVNWPLRGKLVGAKQKAIMQLRKKEGTCHLFDFNVATGCGGGGGAIDDDNNYK